MILGYPYTQILTIYAATPPWPGPEDVCGLSNFVDYTVISHLIDLDPPSQLIKISSGPGSSLTWTHQVRRLVPTIIDLDPPSP